MSVGFEFSLDKFARKNLWTKCPIKFDGWQFVKFVKDLVKPENFFQNPNWKFQSNFTKRYLEERGLTVRGTLNMSAIKEDYFCVEATKF